MLPVRERRRSSQVASWASSRRTICWTPDGPRRTNRPTERRASIARSRYGFTSSGTHTAHPALRGQLGDRIDEGLGVCVAVEKGDVPRVARAANLRRGRPKKSRRSVRECVLIYRRVMLRLVHDGLQLVDARQSPSDRARRLCLVPSQFGDSSLPHQSSCWVVDRPVYLGEFITWPRTARRRTLHATNPVCVVRIYRMGSALFEADVIHRARIADKVR